MRSHQNITRYDYNKTKAWWVRFVRDGEMMSRLFSDSVHGGKAKALVAAKEYRDAMLAIVGRGKKSGLVVEDGTVQRKLLNIKDKQGRVFAFHYYVAWIRVAPGKIVQARASVDKWGEREAKARMEAWLNERRKEQKRNYPAHKIVQKA